MNSSQRGRLLIGSGIALVVTALALLVALYGGAIHDDAPSGTDAVAAAEGVAGPTTAGPSRVVSESTVATTAPSTTAPRGPLGSGEPVTLAFGGDVHFEGFLRGMLDADPQGALLPITPLFEGADLSVVNLESAITDGGVPASKEFTFRAPGNALQALRSAGIDVVSMANNHGLDYGPEGVEDALAASWWGGLPVIGIGRDAAEAYRPFVTEVRGQRIAVIGATQVLDDHLIEAWTATDDRAGLASAKEVDRLVEEVRAARRIADTVVVYLHWGREREVCPTTVQQELAGTLVEAGADILVGGHSHRVEGAGRMGEALVAYGLGNFVWWREDGPSGESGVLAVTVTGRRIDGYEWRPAQLSGGMAQPLSADAQQPAIERWNGLRACTGLTP